MLFHVWCSVTYASDRMRLNISTNKHTNKQTLILCCCNILCIYTNKIYFVYIHTLDFYILYMTTRFLFTYVIGIWVRARSSNAEIYRQVYQHLFVTLCIIHSIRNINEIALQHSLFRMGNSWFHRELNKFLK
jgi:hypothetical protein